MAAVDFTNFNWGYVVSESPKRLAVTAVLQFGGISAWFGKKILSRFEDYFYYLYREKENLCNLKTKTVN